MSARLVPLGLAALLLAAPAAARDFGQQGAVFPVIEADLLSVIQQRLRSMQASGAIDRANRQLAERTAARVRRPLPVPGIVSATEERRWTFDPTITVRQDLRDGRGRIVVAAGTRVNPLDTVPLRQRLVFVDGDDPAQVAWARSTTTALNAKLILVGGSPFALMKAEQRRFYFDQQGTLTRHFGIHAVPALVEQQGRTLAIRELVIPENKRRSQVSAMSNREWFAASARRRLSVRRRVRWLLACLAALVLIVSFVLASPARAEGTPGRCTGRFVNPITDVCWSCMFPMSVGGLNIWPSLAGRPDTDNPALPVCACGLRVGIAMGFWEPVRLADVSMKPWCFVNLGGLKLDPGFDIGFKTIAGPSAIGGKAQNTSGWHVHWYAYPLLYWMEIVADFLCLEQGSIDILYITEVDPLWQDSELTALINPEAVLFANPLALAACAADCVAASARLPTDPLFWCAGCQGTMYPLNGNIGASIGHVQASRLALARFAYKLHRELVAWGTMGSKGLCGSYLMPVMRKQQYRFQATNPNPQTGGRYACAPIGASTTFMSAGQVYPAIGEDMGYLVWRKRNCCVL